MYKEKIHTGQGGVAEIRKHPANSSPDETRFHGRSAHGVVLPAEESLGTIEKRFNSVDVQCCGQRSTGARLWSAARWAATPPRWCRNRRRNQE